MHSLCNYSLGNYLILYWEAVFGDEKHMHIIHFLFRMAFCENLFQIIQMI